MTRFSAPRTTWKESDRLAALARYRILDTEPERAFSDVVQLLAQLLDAPIAAINLIDRERQWFKAEIGLGTREMPLDDSLCKWAILETGGMVIPDTFQDPRFACNPLVTGAPGLRFYAGALLETSDGYPLGTLCVLDTRPRPEGLTEQQQFVLKTLANQVMSLLELHRVTKQQDELLAERERVEAELRRERDNSEQLLEGMDEGFQLLDGSLTVRRISAGGARLLQCNAADVVGRPLAALWPEPLAVVLEQTCHECLQDGQVRNFEQELPRDDGRTDWLEFRILPAPDEVAVFYRDITGKRQAEEALRVSEERLAATFRQAAVGISEVDLQGRFRRVNKALCCMLGYPADTLLQLNFTDVTYPEDLPQSMERVARTVRTGEPFSIEKRYRRADGSHVWAATHVSRYVDLQGRPQGLIAIITDLSARKQAENELRQVAGELAEANRRQTEFLATLAHELRNPLAPIRSSLEVMRMSGQESQTARRMHDIIDRQVRHMVHLIDDLLDLGRITHGKLELKKARIPLRSVLETAVETSRPLIESEQHGLVVSVDDEPLMLYADSTRIAQVISNLLNNAAKYTPPGGTILLRAQRQGQDVVISVQDNGEGLPSDALSKVFEMFTQVGTSSDRAKGGLGVGLTLVRQLVQLHGGSVSAQSAGPGQGSTFTVRLPLARDGAHGERAALDGHETEHSIGASLRLLVVDDNRDAAEALSRLLQSKGHQVEVAGNGAQALALAPQFRPSLVFLDIGLPGMDGYEVARRFRTLEGLERSVLVALTGWGAPEDRARSHAAGFDAHLIKPAELSTIEALLARVATGTG